MHISKPINRHRNFQQLYTCTIFFIYLYIFGAVSIVSLYIAVSKKNGACDETRALNFYDIGK